MDHSLGYTYAVETAYETVDSSNDKAPYQNPAQIQSWAGAVSTMEGLAEQQTLDLQNGGTHPFHESWSTGGPHMPGYLSHSNSSDGSEAWKSVPMQRSNATDMNNLSQSGSSTGFAIPQDLGFEMLGTSHGDHCTMDFSYPLSGQSYPSPAEDDMSFSPTETHFLPGAVRETLGSRHGFLTSPDMRTGPTDDAYSNGWNDGSLSSSLSYVPDTPMSLPLDRLEDSYLGAQQAFVHGSNQLPSPAVPYFDVESTMRPVQGSQRNSLPEQWMQPPSDIAGQSHGSPISTFASSRRSSDGEPLSARKDPLYQLKPRDDGYYKCVFMDGGKVCEHEPFKLKCNYDKHLDSHLKPYRCKQPGCAENPFSSTACLLRHEREAHGMHNHKEVLCKFNCERSRPGKGFPRKWNANDHMKRVHRYNPPEDSTSNNGEGSSPSASSIDMTFSETPALTVRTSKRQAPDTAGIPEPSTVRKTKPSSTSGRSARGVGRAPRLPAQGSRGQSFTEQDALSELRCAQILHAGTDLAPWHQQFNTAV